MQRFFKTYFDLLESIEDSIKKERIIPGLILIYSAIDSFSSLTEISNQEGKKIFIGWVKKWMLTRYPLPCNADDIYSARCGLLHQHMSDSSMTKQKRAKKIFYVWGRANIKLLEAAIKNSEENEYIVAVRIEDLLYSLRNGMADCISEIEKDEAWKNKFEIKAKKLFVSIYHEK